jgi:hypothetical protein
MYGMSEYLMIAHEAEKARRLIRNIRENRRGKQMDSARSSASTSYFQSEEKPR